MFGNLKIGQRIISLIVIQAIILLFVGLISIYGLRSGTESTLELDKAVNASARLSYVVEPIRTDFLELVRDLSEGKLGWQDAATKLSLVESDFEDNWNIFIDSLSAADLEFTDEVLTPYRADIKQVVARLQAIIDGQDGAALENFASNEAKPATMMFVSNVQASIAEQDLRSNNILVESQRREKSILIITIVAFIAGIFVSSVLGILIYQSIAAPIGVISETVRKVSNGDISARAGLEGNDELSSLGRTLDELLRDKMATLDQSARENRILNDSIINLLRAVSLLSQRDLTINLPVTEDVTGPLADAINKLTRDTSAVLTKVTHVAERVGLASEQVDSKANFVKNVAMTQQQDLAKTAQELAQASVELNNIVAVANNCNQIAGRADKSTQTATATVTDTLRGMNTIRETINEAGKRIKRLGERSQEIGTVVDLIKDVAERTHVLALNSSVQAAAAGEAGRGFAVIAEEVQRLAENAKRATGEISSLVKNIQIETNDTMTTMEKTIGYVVEGSKLAESAGQQMQETQQITGMLVAAVREIAANTEKQAWISNQLRERAQVINQSTQDTARELDEQLDQTRSLTDFCKQLISSVKIFKLPAAMQSA
ncbi:MAG TPA: methyl-accepting chemotaxis protein [Gammaproteobacteria bacterium]|nr:methyl-accepting chemotaxis protein [Gammaproteobacteria bacterium]